MTIKKRLCKTEPFLNIKKQRKRIIMKNTVKKILFLFSVLTILFSFSSCFTPELTKESIYEIAKESGYEGTLEEFIEEFRGKDGLGVSGVSVNESNHLIVTLSDGSKIDCGAVNVKDGKDGKDGSTVTIGENGNWYIDGADTGIKATAEDGEDGKDGKDGSTVTIGSNGNWYIDGIDTGLAAEGKDGEDGNNLSIGSNGNWFIDGVDTGRPARGEDGSSWLNGEGEPNGTLGSDGDFYLDTLTYDVYKKSFGAWSAIANFSAAATGAPVSPSLVAAKGFFSSVIINAYNNNQTSAAAGSGVIYKLDKASGDAYIITNYHVVFDSDSGAVFENINAWLFGLHTEEKTLNLEFVGGSMNEDIAVLRIQSSEVLKTSSAIAVDVGSLNDVFILDEVTAIGNAEGLGMSATRGCVSVDSEFLTLTGADGITEVQLSVFRIDAAVNHGNSGGGLFDKDGKLIGIVNAKMQSLEIDNIGFAIPVDIAVAVADNIISFCEGTELVNPQRVSFGIQMQIYDGGASFDSVSGKIFRKDTIEITDVTEESFADGKFLPGDVFKSIKINDTVYSIEREFEFSAVLFEFRTGDEITFFVMRNGVETPVSFTVTDDLYIDIV